MARAHVTEELIQVVKVQHKKHPAFTQRELAERIGCSAATVGRILAGEYDENCKRTDKDELYSGSEKKRQKYQSDGKVYEREDVIDDMVRDEDGKIRFVPRDENHVLGPNDTFETSMDDEIAARKGGKTETVFKIDTSNVARAELLKSIIDILAGAPTPKPSVPATPIPEERFKYEVLTELKTIKEIEADTYKELKQLKGILADIRDMLK